MANAPRLSVAPESSRPKKLGRYELEERLGGDEGVETFRARVRGLAGFDRIFAVKCVRRPRGSQVNLNDPFIKSARRLASINDPRLARVLDADVIDGVAVAVTEFVHGLDLDRFRECAQFAGVLATGNDEAGAKWQKIVAYVGAEVAGGLAVLHGLTPPLVHGGLSPRNIVATARGAIKILDAGLAPSETVSTAKRSAAYVAGNGDGGWTAPGDVRALGAMLFELATGELPAPGDAGAMAHKVLESLWPSMADFIAGMLSEEPGSRPHAAEVAKTLGDYWSDIPDASMVTEMAALVRNFSAFVTDAGVQNTASPIVHAPPPVPDPQPALVEAEVFSIRPEAPSAPRPVAGGESIGGVPEAAPTRGQFDDDPTVVRTSGSYAAALFQAAPTDSEIDQSLALAGLESPPPARPNPPVNATLMAYPSLPAAEPAPEYVPPEDSLSIPLDDGPAAGPAPEASMDAAFPALAPSSDAIPELEDWGAQALASLGDQAGVAIAPLSPAPAVQASLSAQPPPPPVSDPAIEAAFDFMASPSPGYPPAEQSGDEPMLEAQAELEPEPSLPPASAGGRLADGLPDASRAGSRDASVSASAAPSVAQALLEDELVDETTGAGREALAAAEPVLEVEAFEPPAAAEVVPEPIAFAATVSSEPDPAPAESEARRLAHAMAAPQEVPERPPQPKSAARASSADVLSEVEAEALANSTRGRRIAIGVALFLLAGGAVAGGLSAFGVFGDKHQATMGKTSHSSRTVVPSGKPAPTAPQATAAAPAAPPATRATPAAPAAPPAPTVATSKPVALEKPASGAATGSVSVTSTPAGATVWVDGQERGTTPCSVKLARGPARLTLVLAGHLSSTSTVEAGGGKPIALTLQPVAPPLTGEARFRAECTTTGKLPIVVDGRETGVLCPNSKLRVDPGPHSIGVLIPATGKVHAKEITLSAGVRSIVFGD